jgi:hypothetical protein
MPLYPPKKPTYCPEANPGCRGGKPATNAKTYDTAFVRAILDVAGTNARQDVFSLQRILFNSEARVNGKFVKRMFVK